MFRIGHFGVGFVPDGVGLWRGGRVDGLVADGITPLRMASDRCIAKWSRGCACRAGRPDLRGERDRRGGGVCAWAGLWRMVGA